MTTPIADSAAVRAALVELLTTGQHHHAATPATLTATRTALAAKHPHPDYDLTGGFVSPERRLTALAAALGAVGTALVGADPWNQLNITILRAGLCDLAAVALGWLDPLPTPPTGGDSGDGEQPF